jgi:hypothetical protein
MARALTVTALLAAILACTVAQREYRVVTG